MRQPFPSWNRSILTDIYLCHAFSRQDKINIEDGNGRAGIKHSVHKQSKKEALRRRLEVPRPLN
eukprot:COSAG01_NODE_603_length_14905_cov_12.534648_13_plen_64_part_00